MSTPPNKLAQRLKALAAARDASDNVANKGPKSIGTDLLPIVDPAGEDEMNKLRKLGDGMGGEYTDAQIAMDNAGDVEGLRRSQQAAIDANNRKLTGTAPGKKVKK